MPKEYEGREQTFLKHVVLEDYFGSWLYKLAIGTRAQQVWYVDCFAGPWKAKQSDLQDTSFAKALRLMNTAVRVLREKHNHTFRPRAVFVEANASSCAELSHYVSENSGAVDARVIQGEFGDAVPAIAGLLGDDPAMLFVDPTGWKGADMRFIAPLAGKPRRDVLINMMFEHINRFKDCEHHDYIAPQMRAFFGLADADLRPDMTEVETMALYRTQLSKLCGMPVVADLVVPLATKERTKFRLVVGSHHDAALKLFRDVEFKACGKVAADVRSAARDRAREQQGALSLFPSPPPPLDSGYAALRQDGLLSVRRALLAQLAHGPEPFSKLWPDCLRDFHVRRSDVCSVVRDLRKRGRLVVDGWMPRQRLVRDDQTVRIRSVAR